MTVVCINCGTDLGADLKKKLKNAEARIRARDKKIDILEQEVCDQGEVIIDLADDLGLKFTEC